MRLPIEVTDAEEDYIGGKGRAAAIDGAITTTIPDVDEHGGTEKLEVAAPPSAPIMPTLTIHVSEVLSQVLTGPGGPGAAHVPGCQAEQACSCTACLAAGRAVVALHAALHYNHSNMDLTPE
jgi:hypothetical protein